MDITRASLKNPAAVAAAVALVALFGFTAMRELPMQLFPDIDQPQMSVVTNWRAASTREIESEILEPQEEVLQGLPGLEQMDANANPGPAGCVRRMSDGPGVAPGRTIRSLALSHGSSWTWTDSAGAP